MATRRMASGAGEALVPQVPSLSEGEALDGLVASLSSLNMDQLRLQWRNHLGGIAPAHLPGWLLMRVLAYRIQAAAFGDLDRAILRRLRERGEEAFESGGARPFVTRGPTTREGAGLRSGALLVREWNGRLDHDPRGRVRLEWLRLPQPFAGRQGDHGHELERTPLLRAEGGQERRFQQKEERRANTELLSRYWHVLSPRHARARKDRPFAASRNEESGSASPIELALPPSCEGRPKIRQIGPRKDPRSDPSEVPRQARAIGEVGR